MAAPPVQFGTPRRATDIHPTTVNGRPAVVHASDSFDGARPQDRFVGVRWRLADGRWAQTLSFGPRSEAQVLRFARGLTTGSVRAGEPPFTFRSVPPGLTLQHQSDDDYMCLATAAIIAANSQPAGLCVQLTTEDQTADLDFRTGEVNGRPATYDLEIATLQVDLGGGRFLDITWDPAEIPLTRDDAFRFAEGVQIPR